MKVYELVEKLQQYPSDAIVILAQELGASELEETQISFEQMNYIEYPPYNKHLSPYYGWEYPSEYERKVLLSTNVVVIS